MKCSECGEELRLSVCESVLKEYATDTTGEAGRRIYGTEPYTNDSLWYGCGCQVCPYEAEKVDAAIVARLKEEFDEETPDD